MSIWYYKVVDSLMNTPECISHFDDELESARLELEITGKTLEKHQAELPGIVEHRYAQLQEIEAILEHLNILFRQKRASVFKDFLEKNNKVLSSRDAEKYTDGNQEVVGLAMLINEFALIRNKFLAISKGLEQKSWMMGHITKLKCAGLDDARVS
jgi:hypothetical protein